jgi:hypothetical protein
MAMTREEMQRLASYGRNGDTMLAHINPQEAALLKSMGGAGTINPKTGLPEFYGIGQFGFMPQRELEPLPSLGQALAPESLANLATQLNTTTVPQVNRGLGGSIPAYTKVSDDYSQYANRDLAQVRTGAPVIGYTLPSEQTFAGKPLEAKYDTKGNFKNLEIAGGDYITLDPNQPNIVASPKINAKGEIIDYGVFDLDQQSNGSFGSFVREFATDLGPILSSVLAYYMPGITGALAPSLTSVGITNSFAQSVVSSALANAVVSVAQGAPLDVALQNAVTNAVVTSGSPAIARDINSVISNPAVTNAIVSAGSSAAITALNGGSESDITRNIIGGLVGSGTASATDNRVIGSVVGGAITGGVAGAITGGVGAYGAEADARDRATRQTSGTSADPGIRVAGGDDATALKMASISAMPEMLGKSGETASPLSSIVEGGQTFYERTITGKSPDGKDYSYTVTYDPGATAGRRVSYSTSGVVLDAQGDVIPSAGGGATASFTRPTFTAKDTGVYTPTIITTGQTFSPSTRTTADTTSRIQSVIDLRSAGTDGSQIQGTTAGTGDTETSTNVGTGNTASTGTFTSSGYSGRNTTGIGTGTGRGTGTGVGTGRGTGTGTGAGGEGDGTGSGGEGDGTGGDGTGDGSGYGGEGDGTGGGRDLPPVEDRTGTPVPYTPKIFTYGGVESTLPTTLRTTMNVPTASTTTGTSVGLGGRGEIESKESGKKRQNVWNEESLRLKDALGL